MSTLTLQEAIDQFSSFPERNKNRIEMKSVSSADTIGSVSASFIKHSVAAGWYYDENLEWHTFTGDAPPRSEAEMVEHFKDLAFVQRVGVAARVLRDKFLSLLPGREHVPLLEGLYDNGFVVDAEGALVDPSA